METISVNFPLESIEEVFKAVDNTPLQIITKEMVDNKTMKITFLGGELHDLYVLGMAVATNICVEQIKAFHKAIDEFNISMDEIINKKKPNE